MADFIFVSTLPFLAVTMMKENDFIFGKAGCHLLTFLIYSSMYTSAYTVMFKKFSYKNQIFIFFNNYFFEQIKVAALSVDRYFAVASPVRMRKYRTKQMALSIAVVLWIIAISRNEFQINSNRINVFDLYNQHNFYKYWYLFHFISTCAPKGLLKP